MFDSVLNTPLSCTQVLQSLHEHARSFHFSMSLLNPFKVHRWLLCFLNCFWEARTIISLFCSLQLLKTKLQCLEKHLWWVLYFGVFSVYEILVLWNFQRCGCIWEVTIKGANNFVSDHTSCPVNVILLDGVV